MKTFPTIAIIVFHLLSLTTDEGVAFLKRPGKRGNNYELQHKKRDFLSIYEALLLTIHDRETPSMLDPTKLNLRSVYGSSNRNIRREKLRLKLN